MRSESLLALRRSLCTINRDLSHACFVFEQFRLDHETAIQAMPDALTGEVFCRNPYGRMFNYRLHRVPAVCSDALASLLAGSCVFVYTTFEAYLVELLRLAGHIHGVQFIGTKPDKTPWFEHVCSCLGIADRLAGAETLTVDYMRLRRNALAHARRTPSSELSTIVRLHGADLTAYWKEAGLAPVALGFASPPDGVPKLDEFIDILRITRHLAQRVDQEVLSCLGCQALVAYLAREFRTAYAQELTQKTRERMEGKFAAYANMRLGIEHSQICFEDVFDGV